MAAPQRLGLIGAGRWGRNYIRTIDALPGVRLSRLASRNPDSVRIAPADCAVVPDWRDLLDRNALDGVIIATPPGLHAEMALAAIDAGLPVLIEKPLTLDIAQARALSRKALERRAIAMVNHTHLFHPAYRALKSLLPDYGLIREIRAEAGSLGPFRLDTPVLWDWGAHDVAMCIDIMRERPSRVSARILERREVAGGHGETLRLELEFPNRVGATIVVSNILATKTRRLTVTCDRAALVYDDFAAEKLLVHAREQRHAVAFEPDLPLSVVVREFAAAISTRTFDATALDTGLSVVETLSACAATLPTTTK